MCAHIAYLYVAILNCVEYSHKCILYAMHRHARLLTNGLLLAMYTLQHCMASSLVQPSNCVGAWICAGR